MKVRVVINLNKPKARANLRLIDDSLRVNPTANRLFLRLFNEARASLREGVVTDRDLLDAGMIFGTGFAPFRGGPLYYLDKRKEQEDE